jgi:GxxExxY protein
VRRLFWSENQHTNKTNQKTNFTNLDILKHIIMSVIIFKDESYKIIGTCFDVHNELGLGFQEIVYKDALELEFINRGIPYVREKEFQVYYKGNPLKDRKFYVDFFVYDKILLEIKAKTAIIDEHIAQTLNYCACANQKLGLCVNFGALKLESKRVVL